MNNKGRISIDDQDITKVSLYSLRKKIFGKPDVILDDTIENNIKYAKLDASKGRLMHANRAADEFIQQLPENTKL